MTKHVEVMELVAQLKAAEETFVLATVVRTVSVTAAKAGAKAIIRPDGTIVAGWIGGGCARGAVLKAARESLVDGEPRMVSVQPENLLAELGVKPGENRDGVRFAENMCPSKGTMDIFVEPVLPHPSLVILGVSPVALSLAAQARQLGYHVTVAAPVADLPNTKRGASSWCRRKARATKPPCAQRCRSMPPITPSSAAAARWRRCARNSSRKASTHRRSIASRRRPGSISAPSRRKKSRCRFWRRSRWSGDADSAERRAR
jgi:xanthine/CO dehydrogenase XdhC/CoxF family maturation factor